MVSNAVLKNNFSITTKRVRLTRSQLEKQSSGLKALYALSSGISPASASSSSSCSRTNSESSFTHSEEGIVSAASPQRFIENINKNQFSCDDLSLGSIMSPIPSQGDDDGEEGNADHEEVAQLVTLSPKPPTTPTFTPEQRSAYPLNGITEPGPNDCLCGRGGGTNHHLGNKSYRAIVESHKDLYSKSTRLEKPLVATGIISDWRELSPPGRFLKQDAQTNLWEDIGDKKAKEKTSQALREKTPVNSREVDGSGDGGGREEGDYRRTARFEPEVTSPVGRNVKHSSLVRDHSLGTEIVGSNESFQGFTWDETDQPVVTNENANVSPSAGGGKYGGQRYASSHSQHHHHPQHHPQQHHHYPQQHPQHHHYPQQHHHYPQQHPPQHQYGEYPPQHPQQQQYPYYPPPSGYGPPPPPPYDAYGSSPQHGQWPTSPPGHPAGHAPPQEHALSPSHHHDPHAPSLLDQPSPQFSDHYPSAFGWYNSNNSGYGRSNSLRSLGSSVDAYDRRDSAASSGAGGASTSVGGAASGSVNGSVAEENITPPNTIVHTAQYSTSRDNTAAAGTSMDYSKIAELIRDSSDKSSSTTLERSTSLDEGSVANNGNSGYEDTILRSKSLPYEESGGMRGAVVGGSPRVEMAVVNEDESTPAAVKPSLLRKLSGGALTRNASLTSTPPNGILRPNPINGVHRPDPVKRDTSNQPETFETKRSIKRVVLSRDQSAVSRRLKEEQGLGGGGARVSSRLTKSEMLDRKLSVGMNQLELHDAATNNARSLSYGVPPLDRERTEDVLASFINDDSGLVAPAPPMAERLSSIEWDQMRTEVEANINSDDLTDTFDFNLGISEDPEQDVSVIAPNSCGVDAETAKKWLKGET